MPTITTRLALFISCLLLVPSAMAEQTVVLVSDPWPPYIVGKLGEEANDGTTIEVIKLIFAEVDGLEVSLPLTPWNRALKSVKEGAADGIQMLRKTKERETYMVFTNRVFLSREQLWYSQQQFTDGFHWQTIDDLKPYVIGVVDGYSYSEIMDDALATKQLTAVKARDADQLFAMLAAGRIDVALASEAVGKSLARQYQDRQIIASDQAVAEEPHYIGIAKNTEAVKWIPDINRAIDKLMANGSIDRIIYQ